MREEKEEKEIQKNLPLAEVKWRVVKPVEVRKVLKERDFNNELSKFKSNF